jgi:hypothetical protein
VTLSFVVCYRPDPNHATLPDIEWTSFRYYLLISFTRLTLDIYFVYITSSCKTLPTWTLSSFFNYISLFPDLRVSRLLEIFSSTPSHLVHPYKLNAVDYVGNAVVDLFRYDGTGQCNLALRYDTILYCLAT